MKYHEPVLLSEVLEHLKVNKGKKYIDCTLGDGGHTVEILKNGGIVLGLDINEESLKRAKQRIAQELNKSLQKNFFAVLGNFKNINELVKGGGLPQDFSQVNGILYDLGYSSFQMDEGEEGLSFQRDLPLDMRLDKSLGVTATDLVGFLSESQLTELIFKLSGERFAKKFAGAIVKARKLKKIQSTKELAEILVSAVSPGYERGRIHPATRTFQALRIAVNDELGNLEQSLPRAARLLLPGGVLIVISFHSLEDKLAKDFGQGAPPSIFVRIDDKVVIKPLYKKPLTPSQEEVKRNVRARSAKMRVFERNI